MAHLDMTVGSDTSQAGSMARKIGMRDTQGCTGEGRQVEERWGEYCR